MYVHEVDLGDGHQRTRSIHQYILAFGVLNFDLDVGQSLEVVYPKIDLGDLTRSIWCVVKERRFSGCGLT